MDSGCEHQIRMSVRLNSFGGSGAVGVFLLWCNFNESHFLVFCVVSVLGRMVDALASEADEGRGRLRYASGSCQPSVDPRMSEWGNPARVMSCYPYLNT